MPAFTINEVNGIPVHSLEDYRKALFASVATPYITIKASDNVRKTSDNIFVVLPFEKVVEDEKHLSQIFRYPISKTVQELLALIEKK